MTKPEPDQGGAERRDPLDRLHEQGKRRAAGVPYFDAEETLQHVLRHTAPPGRQPPQESRSATVALSIGRRVLQLNLEIYRRGPRGDRRSRSLTGAKPLELRWSGRRSGPALLSLDPGVDQLTPLLGVAGAGGDSTPANFWDALGPAERTAFQARAEEQVFANGARLMQEGETADHVAVVVRGSVEISIESDGVERIIAVRGPGQLVGERAALQVSVRSATVTAVGTVQTLTMTTAAFAAFVSEYPSALSLVEEQVYDRLTERSGVAGPQDPAGSGRVDTAHALPGPVAGRDIEPLRLPLRGENCTVVYSDVVAFGARMRSDDDRSIARDTLWQTMADAFGNIWNASHPTDRGDGLLVVVPPEIPTADVLDCMRTALPPTVRRRNTDHSSSARMQLRVALDVGPVVSDVTGLSGDVIRRAARLALAPALKRAMSKNRATVGVIVSDFIYETAIRQADGPIATHYEEIHAEVKQAALPTRIQLIA